MTRNARAWALACRLFEVGEIPGVGGMGDAELALLPLLYRYRALRTRAHLEPYAVCPHCMKMRVPALDLAGQRWADCPDCGPMALSHEQELSYSLDPKWLTARLRIALGLERTTASDELAEGVWQLGMQDGALVLLLRDVDLLMVNFNLFMRLRRLGRGRLCLIAPLRSCTMGPSVLDDDLRVLPLEECFCLYGERVFRVGRDGAMQLQDVDERSPALGPFSLDFRWVHLPGWPGGPIALRPAQAKVFKALWSFKGEPRSAEDIMQTAGLASPKPVDIFKVPARHQGNPGYEGPLHAYRTLVLTLPRPGTYALRREWIHPDGASFGC